LRVDEFLVERWLNEYEKNVEVNMAETCVQPFTLREFLDFVSKPNFFEEIMDLQLTYGHIEGNPRLREGISMLYSDADPEDVLVTGGAIEANFNAFYTLVEPGDTVISVFPSYQQLYSVAKGFGATVKLLNLRPENQWLPEVEELKQLVDKKTKMIVINNPHNPTGSLIDEPMLKAICELAEDVGSYVLSDEAYRGLYINPGEKVPSIVDVYDKGIATGSFSKSISLTGLRLGWITGSHDVIKECMLHRDYTTISKGLIDESLAVLAVENIDSIFERNLNIVRRNHKLVDDWINEEPVISWIPPRAGSVGFMKHNLEAPAENICKELIEEKSTLMVPGDCFEMPDHIRIGYGNAPAILEEGLTRFKEYLHSK
jgi:aspartate/methionine/tyrosine aminotransferase